MKHKEKLASVAFLLLGLGGLYAQEKPTASGGEATGNGGSSSYSVGQVVYTTDEGTTGSVAKGVQQPFEISIVTGIDELGINLDVSVYPNPTTNFLKLQVESEQVQSLSYQLLDLQGKVISSENVSANNTTINMESLPTATYFLRVNNSNQNVKTFKIIKN